MLVSVGSKMLNNVPRNVCLLFHEYSVWDCSTTCFCYLLNADLGS
jgi:hypothetical protein